MNASKEEKRACPFSSSTPRRKKTTKSFCKEWASLKISRERQRILLQSRKKTKNDKAPEKPLETTTESSFMSFLASRSSFLGREAAKQVTKSQEVPCHIKSGRRTVLKVYCSDREASTKNLGSDLLSIFPEKCRTFGKCIE